ncbi:MAG: hypothetical protein ACI9Y1_001834 [Lentisphaeria bacterium]|jgi:hypothetical protein
MLYSNSSKWLDPAAVFSLPVLLVNGEYEVSFLVLT